MFKPVIISADTIRNQAEPRDADGAGNVFKVLHGFYGNLFLSKFASGQTGDDGADMGVTSAKIIWAHGLRKYGASVVKSALNQCLTDHPKFPPSLPEFVAMCAACQPREVYHHPAPALPMSGELRSKYAASAREINARHARKAIDKATGYVALPTGLDGIKQAIANAVATAGGDEARELLRLDVLFAPRAAA
jgi:hypothetical protein